MTYSLYRTRDGAGDSGQMSMALVPDQAGKRIVAMEQAARPRVGVAMRVGSIYARSMQRQDWWQTTVITEIIEDKGDEVRFKTGNSEYVWKEF
jgi:hypothetical protein